MVQYFSFFKLLREHHHQFIHFRRTLKLESKCALQLSSKLPTQKAIANFKRQAHIEVLNAYVKRSNLQTEVEKGINNCFDDIYL